MVDAAIVTARSGSSRLPNKMLKLVTDDLTAIDITIQRAKLTGFDVILCVPIDDRIIFEKIANRNRVKLFSGSRANKIKRWYDCFREYDINNALLVDGDDLAYSYEIGIRAMGDLRFHDQMLVKTSNDIITGLFTYAISRDGIETLYLNNARDELDTDIITDKLSVLKVWYTHLYNQERRKNIRLTLDYYDDLLFFKMLYHLVPVWESTRNIIELLTKYPHLYEVNWSRQNDYILNQQRLTTNESVENVSN